MHTLRELVEPIEVAAALGAEIAAPLGTHGFLLYRHTMNTQIIGHFQTEEGAKLKLLSLLSNRGDPAPWNPDMKYRDPLKLTILQKEYFVDHTLSEALAWFKASSSSHYYSHVIMRFIIRPEPPLGIAIGLP